MKRRIEAKDVYTETVGALYDEGDVSRGPMSRDMLLHLAAEHGVGPDSLVLDIGCANGGVSRKLLERTGCRIEGVELLEFLVAMGKKDNSIAGVDGRFAIQQGSILDIPFENNHFDFVVCIDVLGMVDDVSKALVECRRVLKPQGKMLIYTSFPTDRLSEREARELNETGAPRVIVGDPRPAPRSFAGLLYGGSAPAGRTRPAAPFSAVFGAVIAAAVVRAPGHLEL